MNLRWSAPPAISALPDEHSVHVWAALLDRPSAELRALRATLSADELERASRFRRDRDANRFIAGRGILRSILAGYVERVPRSLRFRYRDGKPSIADPDGSALHFNLAHSDRLALYAFTTAAEVGVDVEQVSSLPDARDIAVNYFAPSEIRDLAAAPDEAVTFYRCWTRKEAFIKALGEGLGHPLDQFAVTVTADERPSIRHVRGDVAEAGRWSLMHLEPADGFIGAVAVRAAIHTVECMPWNWRPGK